jgi:NAD(P)-dependent dehydrogenase (short-subunit alcohol dehydrogenase family)
MERLASKVALITGGTQSIGKAIATLFHAEGAQVVIAGRKPDWHAVHRVNLDGIFLGCKYALTLMKHSDNGSIVNIGSRSGLVGVPSSAAYSSSKAAIRNYTKTVALHCANRGYRVRCNIIHPAAILTKMWDKELGNDEKRDQRIAEMSKHIPLKRMGQPSDIAYAALYLASDESLFMTGTELLLDGGIMAGSSAAANETVIEMN